MFSMLNKKSYIQLSLSFLFSLSFISHGSAMGGYDPRYDLHSGLYSCKGAVTGGKTWSANVIIRRDFFYKYLLTFYNTYPKFHTNVRLSNKVPSLDPDTEKQKQEILSSYLCTPEELKVRLMYLKEQTCFQWNNVIKNKNPDILELSIDTKTDDDFSPHGTPPPDDGAYGINLYPCCLKHDISKPLWKEVNASVNKNFWHCKDCEISYKTVGWGPLRAPELDVFMKAIETLDFIKEIHFRGSHDFCKRNAETPCPQHPAKEPFKQDSFCGYSICEHFNIDKLPVSETVWQCYALSKGVKYDKNNEEDYWSTLGSHLPKYLDPTGPFIEKEVLIKDFSKAVKTWKDRTQQHLNKLHGKASSQATANQSTNKVETAAKEQDNTPPPTKTGAALPMINTQENPNPENKETLTTTQPPAKNTEGVEGQELPLPEAGQTNRKTVKKSTEKDADD